MFAKIILLVIFTLFSLVYAYKSGAPLDTCENMTPMHFDKAKQKYYPVQSSAAPFTVKIKPISGTVPAKLTYSPGDKFEVTIDGGADHEIEGVFIQARRLDYRLNTIEPIGEFTAADTLYQKRCFKQFGSALTHRKEVEAHKITMTWTAPAKAQGHLQIFVTIVEHHDTFWVKIPSDKIIYDSSNTGIIPDKPNVDTKDVVITTDECGKTKGCFRLPTGCVNDQCEYIATYGPGTTADDIKIELTTKIDPVAKTAYVALGLSYDEHMGTDSVIQCMMFEGKFKIANSFNEGKHNVPLGNAYAGLSNMKASYKDGRLKCTFDRKKIITQPDDKLYNLENKYYLFLAKGPCLEDTLLMHTLESGKLPKISEKKISLSTSLEDTTIPTSPTDGSSGITPAKDLVIDVSTCGTTKGCFLTPADCKFSDCEYVAAYAKSGENIAFEISAKIATSNTEPYVAIGFSGDQTMGDDSVIGCLYDKSNGKMKVFNSFNNGYTNAAIPEAATGLSAAEGAVSNGNRITCKFQRKKKKVPTATLR